MQHINLTQLLHYKKQALSLWILLIAFFIGVTSAVAQNQFQIRSAIDSTSVKFGSVINYAIQVEENKDKNVIFPEGDSFSPLEVLESYKIDTLDEGGRYRLLKQYALTQFDTGQYYIPKQKIIIGDKTFFTDSLKVEFRDVVIDTSKTKLYDVKGLMTVEDIKESNWKRIVLWSLGILLLAGLVVFGIWKFGIGIKKAKEKLPAYDRAILGLRDIDNSLLQAGKHKEYYSQLTDLAKSYLDEEVTDHALESTTDELIAAMQDKVKNKKVFIDKESILEFRKTLETADLAKFAAMSPPQGVAEHDKKIVQEFIDKVHRGLPEPTEEELLQNEAYRKEQERKQKLQRQKVMLIAGIAALILGGLTFLGAENYYKIRSFVLNQTGASLLHQEWITSTYGVPGVSINTPGLLTRNPIELNEKDQQLLSGNQVYIYGKLEDKFNIIVNTVSFRQDVGFTVEKGIESVFKQIESMGGANILVKSEDYKTVGGTEGAKVFGSFDYQVPETTITIKFDYNIVLFAESQGSQQIFVFCEQEDEDAQEVMKKVINSVEINKSSD